MKKVVFGLLLGTVVSGVYANWGYVEEELYPLEDCYARIMPMESKGRAYVGLNLGGDFSKLHCTGSGLDLGTDGKTKKNNVFSFELGGYGGLGFNLKHLYLGTELAVGYHSFSKENSLEGSSYVWKFKNSQPIVARADLIVGFLTYSHRWLYFAKMGLGTGWNKTKLNVYSSDKHRVSDSESKLLLGFHGGLGFECFTSETMSVRVEAIYGRYKSMDWQSKVNVVTGGNGIDFRYHMRPTNFYLLSLGLAYNF